MVYQFYSLGDKRVVSLKKRPQQGDGDEFWPDNNCVVVGSSRGWVVWFDSLSRCLFLSNPLTHRHLKLSTPALQPDHHNIPTNSDDTRGGITSIMISSPNPDTDPECRAVIIYGPQNKLAFCCPGTAAEWTPLGQRTGYASCVYSTSQKLFFCCFTDKPDEESTGGTLLEAWDLQDPLSPRMIPMAVSVDKDNYPVASGSESERKRLCKSYRFLVVAEQSDELFHVRRFVEHKNDDDHTAPYTTVGFDVHKYVPETGSLEYMEHCLQEQALFVGSSNGFALPAEDYPDDLERCCVYYTAPPQWVGGGYDVGFFHCATKTLHPCFYPCDVQMMEKVTNPPIWFSPTPLVRFPFLIRKEGGALGYNIDPSSPSGQPPTRDERENARQRKEASRGTYRCVYCGFKCDSKTHNGYHSFSYHACTWL
ncbi:Unknown protein [Striga hermonthica]|uniref:KIB1-4 beta-propeller domain-containing protein n=1 Tax=Striga hermonthica TaxID=68872 RepID=A0A9N7NBC1_STRHE|nr:Unknown protein [Striga hermonthica]